MCVPPYYDFLFWDFEVIYPPFSKVLIIMVYSFFPNCSLIGRYGGFILEWMVDFFILTKFESLKMTYPLGLRFKV